MYYKEDIIHSATCYFMYGILSMDYCLYLVSFAAYRYRSMLLSSFGVFDYEKTGDEALSWNAWTRIISPPPIAQTVNTRLVTISTTS